MQLVEGSNRAQGVEPCLQPIDNIRGWQEWQCCVTPIISRGSTPFPTQKVPRKPSKPGKGSNLLMVVWCAFTFIQCSDHYGLESGTWNGEKPKATYQGAAKVNGQTPGKQFRLPYASGVVGNDKAFIKPRPLR